MLHPGRVLLPTGWRFWNAGLAFSRGGDHRLRRQEWAFFVVRPVAKGRGVGKNVRKPGFSHSCTITKTYLISWPARNQHKHSILMFRCMYRGRSCQLFFQPFFRADGQVLWRMFLLPAGGSKCRWRPEEIGGAAGSRVSRLEHGRTFCNIRWAADSYEIFADLGEGQRCPCCFLCAAKRFVQV